MIQKEWVKHSDALPWDSMTGPNKVVKITNYYFLMTFYSATIFEELHLLGNKLGKYYTVYVITRVAS